MIASTPFPHRPPGGRRHPTGRARLVAIAATILVGIASLATAAQAQVRGPRDAGGPAADAAVPDDVFEQSSGTVRLYLVNEFGDVEGILADDDVAVRFPPHMGADLVETLKPGDRYVAQGERQAGGGFYAYTLGKAGSSPLIESRPLRNVVPPAPRGIRAASLAPVRVTGTIAVLIRGPGGDIEGVVLDDGTDVWLPPRNWVTVASELRVGTAFAATGYGTRNRYGSGLRAEQVGFAGQPLRALQPEGPKAPPEPPRPPKPPRSPD